MKEVLASQNKQGQKLKIANYYKGQLPKHLKNPCMLFYYY